MLIEGTERADIDSAAKVMVVDGKPLIREALKTLLEGSGEFEVVANASDAESAARYARGHRPNIVVIGPFTVDGASPDGGCGLGEVIESVHGVDDGIRVLLVTARRDMRQLADALDAGATGIVELDGAGEDFVGAVGLLADGKSHLPPGLALEMVRLGRNDDGDGLTDRERDLLGEIALGYTNQEIASHLHLSVRTIESHRSRIQNKLGVSSRAGLVREALDRGLVH